MVDNFGKRLMKMRKQFHYKQSDVAAQLVKLGHNVTNHTVSRWEQEVNQPTAKQLIDLCAVYQITDVGDAFYDDGAISRSPLNREGREKVKQYERDLIASGLYEAETSDDRPLRQCPLYGLPASAGTGQFLDSSDYEMVEVGDDVPLSANFGVRVSGDSMTPKYHDGDVVWVQQCQELQTGETGIFLHDGQAYLKVFYKDKKGVSLVSLNDAYAPIRVGEEDAFRVFGKVVGRTGTCE